MENSRRKFVKKSLIAGAGLAAISYDDVWARNHSEKHSIKKGMKILFQGDSITDGKRSRNNDWNHIMGHGYAYIIASRLWYDNPHSDLMFYNRGISGNKVQDLIDRWEEDTVQLAPDVISILVGVNDLYHAIYNNSKFNLKLFESKYIELIDKNYESLPNSKLFILEPFLLPVGKVKQNKKWLELMPKMQDVVKSVTSQYNLPYLKLQNKFEEAAKQNNAKYWIWDGIHPMPVGHELIARAWEKTFF